MQQQQKQNVTGKPITNKNSQKIVSDFFLRLFAVDFCEI